MQIFKKTKKKERRLSRKLGVKLLFWTCHNVLLSLLHPRAVVSNFFVMRHLISRIRVMQKVAFSQEFRSAPPIHFVYGFKQSEQFPLYALVAIETAKRNHPHSPIFFFYLHEPYGEYWTGIKAQLHLVQLPSFNYYGLAQVTHYAHRADVVRLLVLRELGGIYFDIDTICIKPLCPLLEADFLMGVQASIVGSHGGLCNATMASRPNSRFVRRWLSCYSAFKSKGRDDLWDFHSVKLPWLLAARHPEDIKVLPHTAFFFPLWNRLIEALFAPNSSDKYMELFEDSYSVHLWNNITNEYISNLTPEWLLVNQDCIYTKLAGNQLLERLLLNRQIMAQKEIAVSQAI